MKALAYQSKGKAEVVERDPPKLRPDYVKVRTVNVALNPTDWKHISGEHVKGAIVGCDFSGVVEDVGEAVTSNVKKGDKIAGGVHGVNSTNVEDGAFAEYIVVKDGTFIHVPDSLSMEEASTLGIAIQTVGQALYKSLKLPYPTEPIKAPFPLLIYGGSTATGTIAIQYAKLSGLQVIATASPKNHELLKSLGADAVFDYNDPECGPEIRQYTNNSLRYVLDTITNDGSMKISAEALSSDSSQELHYSALLPSPLDNFPRKDVNKRFTMYYEGFGEEYEKWGHKTPAKPDEYEFAKKFWATAEKLFEAGKLKAHPVDSRPGGLEGINAGLEDLKKDRVSGKKLVYTV